MISVIPYENGAEELAQVIDILQARSSGDIPLAARRAAIDKIGENLAEKADTTEGRRSAISGVECSVFSDDESARDPIIYFHGGAFCIGSVRSYGHLASRLSTITRRPVYFVEYRLAPEHKYPAAIDDGIDVYRTLIEGGASPDSIAFVGDSAGAALALCVCKKAMDQGIEAPGGIVCISPWVDLALSGATLSELSSRDHFLKEATLRWCAAQYLGDASAYSPDVSPIYDDLKGYPPVLILVGTEEILFDDARRLYDLLEQSGVDVELQIWEKMCHVWPFFYPILSAGEATLNKIAGFLSTRRANRCC